MHLVQSSRTMSAVPIDGLLLEAFFNVTAPFIFPESPLEALVVAQNPEPEKQAE